MNAQTWVEIVALLLGGSGVLTGGVKGVSTLVRMAVAVEQFGQTLKDLGKALESLGSVVQAHETRITVLEQPPQALQNKP